MTDSEIIELYQERVAIMQHDGQLDESKACYQAYLDLRRIIGRGFAIPEEIAKEVRKANAKDAT